MFLCICAVTRNSYVPREIDIMYAVVHIDSIRINAYTRIRPLQCRGSKATLDSAGDAGAAMQRASAVGDFPNSTSAHC